MHTGDLILHKVFIQNTDDTPYYVGWLMIQKITKKFIDVCPIMEESFLKYGCVFTRPIPAVSINSIPTNLRIKKKRINNSKENDDSIFMIKNQHFRIIPKEHYDDYYVVDL